jgi:CTD small phosphatase-like protein 2
MICYFGLQGCDEGSAQCVLQTIFSPSFHISKIAGGEISGGSG